MRKGVNPACREIHTYNTYYIYTMFQLKLTTKNVDIRSSSGLVQNGWISITMDKGSMIVYISRDKNRIYWVGQTNGHSAKMSITFDDNKQMISINKTNKITFHNAKDYNKLKQKTIYYKHMKVGANSVTFS
jgi:hypothetical protein